MNSVQACGPGPPVSKTIRVNMVANTMSSMPMLCRPPKHYDDHQGDAHQVHYPFIPHIISQSPHRPCLGTVLVDDYILCLQSNL